MTQSTNSSAATLVRCTVCGAPAQDAGNKNGHRFFRCSACSHLFVWPMPSNIRDIYTEDYFTGATEGFGYSDYDADKRPMTPTFERYLDLLGRYCGGPGTMLDIGAATGFFLDLAAKRGWSVHGVEASAHAAETARGRGLDVRTGILQQAGFKPGQFDAVTMWDVIEHMEDPGEELERVAELLKPGGILAINTPDSGSLLAKALGMKWHLVVPPEHLNLFTRRSLDAILSRCGFEVLEFGRLEKRFTLQYVIQTLHHVIPLGIVSRTAVSLRGTKVGNWSIPINLRDNVLCFGRKR